MTKSNFYYPKEFAKFIQKKLKEMKKRCPPIDYLTQLLEIGFFVSLHTEEGEPITCTLIYISKDNPDPRPPQRIVADRWSYTRFPTPIALNVNSLIKISKSYDPSASALAVWPDENGVLVIWGAIDQQANRTAFRMQEVRTGSERPGLLEISISGVGVLEIYQRYALLGVFRKGRIAFGFSDVFEKNGPIQNIFTEVGNNLVKEVKLKVGANVFNQRSHWPASIRSDWNRELSRILLRVQNYGHGGAILITPTSKNTGLNIKYPLDYRRLKNAILNQLILNIESCEASDTIHEHFLMKKHDYMPVDLYLDESVADAEREDREEEITGCVQFISSLSRVDGIILMNHELEVRGYGAIIKDESEINSVWISSTSEAKNKDLKKIDPKHFGTRHQSMMRICFSTPGSVGFVVSQDGDVRAMTRVRNKIVIWEDVKLRLSYSH